MLPSSHESQQRFCCRSGIPTCTYLLYPLHWQIFFLFLFLFLFLFVFYTNTFVSIVGENLHLFNLLCLVPRAGNNKPGEHSKLKCHIWSSYLTKCDCKTMNDQRWWIYNYLWPSVFLIDSQCLDKWWNSYLIMTLILQNFFFSLFQQSCYAFWSEISQKSVLNW